MPNLSGMGGSMLDGPMRPQIVHEPKVRRKSSIFRKIRDKLRRGSLISSSTADSAQSAQSTASASSSGKLDFQGFKGIKVLCISQNILNFKYSTLFPFFSRRKPWNSWNAYANTFRY